MNIYSLKGSKVKFLGLNGHGHELNRATKILEIGQVLTVKKIDVNKWKSDVEFEEFPGEVFNTVMFDNIDNTDD